jgi:hypothetical protein
MYQDPIVAYFFRAGISILSETLWALYRDINLRSLTVLHVSFLAKPYFYGFIHSEKPMMGLCVT